MNVLVVIDMQHDFIEGALGTKEAQNIVEKVCHKITNFDGRVVFTRDTHNKNYLETQEGKYLPVEHCIKDSNGWQFVKKIEQLSKGQKIIDKPTFGSAQLIEVLKDYQKLAPLEQIVLVGLCTDICIITNAMLLKTFFAETKIKVDASCCAGVTPQSHKNALDAMKVCQIDIINEETYD